MPAPLIYCPSLSMAAPMCDCSPGRSQFFSFRISIRTREAVLHKGLDRNKDCESPWPQMYCTDGHELAKKASLRHLLKQASAFTRRRTPAISFIGLCLVLIEAIGDEA